MYLALGAPRAAAIPWLYVLISVLSVALFSVNRSFRWLAASQLIPYIVLPFALMWVLGGFRTGSAVALWAAFAPLGALVVSGPRAAAPWLAVFLALLVASAFFEVDDPELLSPSAVESFFVLNLGAVTAVALGLVSVLLGGRDATLDAVRGLIRRYLSPAVASTLLAEPGRLELGGEVAEVTVLFADLRGFTAASERATPDEAVALLNRYFAVALPIVETGGGTPIQLAGDQVMAVFNAPTRHADHAVRAARAALEIHKQVEATISGGPRFGIGLNTGPAIVGNIGSDSYRNFTAVGDTTNLAARLTAEAAPGEIVVGATTADAVRQVARLRPLPELTVKGKSAPVQAFVLEALV